MQIRCAVYIPESVTDTICGCMATGVGKVGFCQCDLDQFETMLLQQWWQKQRSRLQYAVASLSSM